MKLCNWCLTPEADEGPPVADYPIGHERGSQRDPEQLRLPLCGTCISLLESGDLAGFHERYSDERRVMR